MSRRFLLDTNAASAFIRRCRPFRLKAGPAQVSDFAVSSVTAGELLYGLAKFPEATTLAELVTDFLEATTILAWTGEIAPHYGTLRAALEGQGVTIAPLDLMIAAHALAIDATLVSADKALARVGILKIEDWSQ